MRTSLSAAVLAAAVLLVLSGAAGARQSRAAGARDRARHRPHARAARRPRRARPRPTSPGARRAPGSPTPTSPQPDDPDSPTVLWLYDADARTRRVLLDPAAAPDSIDVSSAQWSPAGDKLLLAGETALWTLDVASGRLAQVPARGRGAFDAMQFTPDGRQRLVHARQRPLRRRPQRRPGPPPHARRRRGHVQRLPRLRLQRGAGHALQPARLRLVAGRQAPHVHASRRPRGRTTPRSRTTRPSPPR